MLNKGCCSGAYQQLVFEGMDSIDHGVELGRLNDPRGGHRLDEGWCSGDTVVLQWCSPAACP